ncbi:MAG: hypothetical protein KDK10_12095 [Maritimibacter sp.]|nr:hypothetical protein [Maritimibacter sp.]
MTGWVARLRHRLWAVLTGPGFDRALERHRRAASELDRAVREVLKQ